MIQLENIFVLSRDSVLTLLIYDMMYTLIIQKKKTENTSIPKNILLIESHEKKEDNAFINIYCKFE